MVLLDDRNGPNATTQPGTVMSRYDSLRSERAACTLCEPIFRTENFRVACATSKPMRNPFPSLKRRLGDKLKTSGEDPLEIGEQAESLVGKEARAMREQSEVLLTQ